MISTSMYSLRLRLRILRSTYCIRDFFQNRRISLSTNKYNNNVLNDYSQEDEKKILNIINQSNNELMRYNISKSRIKKIDSWKSKYGQFQTLEQVLEVDGFENNILNKFFKSILNGGDDKKLEKISSKRYGNFCIPNITEKYKLSYKSCISLHIGVSSVTWAKLQLLNSSNQNTVEIKEWKYYAINDRKIQLQELIKKCIEIDSLIPEADCYILENQQMIQTSQMPGNTEQIKTNIQKAQLFAILSFGLMKRNLNFQESNQDLEKPNLFYLKRFLASRLFNLFVGTERVSSERIILDLMRYHYNMENLLDETNTMEKSSSSSPHKGLIVLFPQEIRKIYESSEGYQREFLGQSLLIGLTFINLCLLKCPNSLGIIEGNSKNRI